MTAASTSVALEPLLSRSRERSPSSPRLEGPGWSPPPSPFAFGSLSPKDQKGRRRALVVLLLLAAAILAGSLLKLDDGALRTLLPQTWSGSVGGPAAHLALKAGQRPGEHFRDSLRSDRRYITSFSLAGFNNQIIGAMNLLHLAHLLQQEPYPLPHVVVLPPVTPHYAHLDATGATVGPYPLSSIFDLPLFEKTTGIAVVNWHDVKDLDTVHDFDGAAREVVACWAPWWTQFGSPISGWTMERRLGLERILTPLPPSLLTPTDLAPPHFVFDQLASLLSPPDNVGRRDFLSGWSGDADRLMDRWGRGNESWRGAWGPDFAGWREPEGLREGELVCFDAAYFFTERGEEIRELYEGRSSQGAYGPWSTVGRHLHFNPALKAEAEAVARTVLGLPARARLPRFLTMHIRRGDFLEECLPDWPCLRLVQYEKHLRRLQEKLSLAGLKGALNWPVLVTTDETDPAYLSEIKAKGWHLIDHVALKTKEKMGHWGPTLIDVVALSLGEAFIGTAGSTMSILTMRRIQEWQGGFATLVRKDEQLDPPVS